MLAAILTLSCGAPVPAHLQRPAPDPIVPGFRWWFADYELEVVRVDGECVTYRCTNKPGHEFPGIDGFAEPNQQAKARVRCERRTNLQLRPAVTIVWPWSPDPDE